jgi:hypothetical protein
MELIRKNDSVLAAAAKTDRESNGGCSHAFAVLDAGLDVSRPDGLFDAACPPGVDCSPGQVVRAGRR